jgi:hypothetical protein
LTEGLGKALLLRFEDTSEACRELAVGCFQQLLIKGEEATLHLLPYAMPVLEERLQLLEVRGLACTATATCKDRSQVALVVNQCKFIPDWLFLGLISNGQSVFVTTQQCCDSSLPIVASV